MSAHRPPRPKALLDAIEAESPAHFNGPVWRVVTDGFDPLRPSRAGGRWDDGNFDVLYTSASRDGALAESWFHAAKGQPVIPSKVAKRLYRIQAELHRVLDLSADGKLASFGVNMAAYGRLAYIQRLEEYPTLQQIGEVAFFHEYQAVIVPSARWPGTNVVIMTEHVAVTQLEIVADEPVDLAGWAVENRNARSASE
jgi:RES domain-containing protein